MESPRFPSAYDWKTHPLRLRKRYCSSNKRGTATLSASAMLLVTWFCRGATATRAIKCAWPIAKPHAAVLQDAERLRGATPIPPPPPGFVSNTPNDKAPKAIQPPTTPRFPPFASMRKPSWIGGDDGSLAMKRGFLFGLGSFLVLGVIAGLLSAFGGKDVVPSLILALICMPLSVFVIAKARSAPPIATLGSDRRRRAS